MLLVKAPSTSFLYLPQCYCIMAPVIVGTWQVLAGDEHRELASYTTCAFSIADIVSSAKLVDIGLEDISELIRNSIGRDFNDEDSLGAAGEMLCKYADG
jgi:hypothetical protein